MVYSQSLGMAADAFAVMVSRICGILGGVLISLFLSVLVFPTSASQKATSGLREGLQALTELSRMAWGQEGKEAPGLDGRSVPDQHDSVYCCIASPEWFGVKKTKQLQALMAGLLLISKPLFIVA